MTGSYTSRPPPLIPLGAKPQAKELERGAARRSCQLLLPPGLTRWKANQVLGSWCLFLGDW